MDRVAGLLDEARYEEAMQVLLGEWRTQRAPELEHAIERLGSWLAPAVPPIEPGEEAFYARSRLGRAADLPVLLDRLLDPPKGAIPSRLRALLARPADPRLGAALLRLIEEPPTTASSNFTMWTALFAALPEMVDRRAADRLRALMPGCDLDKQFGRKMLRWLEAVVQELPPVAASVALDVRLDALGPPPDALDEEAPASAAPTATVAQALAALRAEDPEGALDALVWTWGACRDPALSEVIERLGVQVDPKRPILREAAAWLEASDTPRPSAVGRLLETWTAGSLADRELRLAQMGTWSPDPRVARSLRKLRRHERVPAVLALEELHADRPDVLPADEERALQELDAHLSRLVRAPADLERALVDAIVASPGDDGPRLVYADWLHEQGRARGEFIALDVALSAGKKVKAKRDKLLKDANAALGPMAAVLGRSTVVERGFVAHADLRTRNQALEVAPDRRREILQDPGWRTVRTLESRDDPWKNLAQTPLDSLREVRARSSFEGLLPLLDRTDPLGVVFMELQPDDVPEETWARADELVRVLPELRHLDVMGWTREGERVLPPAGFFRNALVQRLDHITCGDEHTGGISDVGAWLKALSGCPVRQVDLVGPHLTATLARTNGGPYALHIAAQVQTLGQARESARWFANVPRTELDAATLTVDGDTDLLREALREISAR